MIIKPTDTPILWIAVIVADGTAAGGRLAVTAYLCRTLCFLAVGALTALAVSVGGT